jgi:hypothetical protein
MERPGLTLAAAVLAALLPVSVAGASSCNFCADTQQNDTRKPLEVEIDSGLVFNRLAQIGNGSGQASIDPQTGTTTTSGDLVNLGGTAFQGHARVTGEPNSFVRIEMPGSVELYSSSGAKAELSDFRTDLPSVPVLDGNGNLEFNFGARMETRGGQGGNFRGRISIRVEYN